MDDFLEAFHPVVDVLGWVTLVAFVLVVAGFAWAGVTDAVRDARVERDRFEQAEADRLLLLEWEARDRG